MKVTLQNLIKRDILIFLLFFALCNLNAQTEINPEVLNLPVLITGKDNTGTGFFYLDSLDLYLVTAKHVILEKDSANEVYFLKSQEIIANYYDRDSDTSKFNSLVLDMQDYLNNQKLIFNEIDDVIIIPIAKYSADLKKVTFNSSISKKSEFKIFAPNAMSYKYVRKFNEVTLGNDIFLFGYPKSLGLIKSTDYDFNIPLLRKGTMAGRNKISRKLIIDCPSYGGNSGGPVFNYKRNQSDFNLVGIVVSFIPYTEIWDNRNYRITNYELDNSGYSIVEPIDKILELIHESN